MKTHKRESAMHGLRAQRIVYSICCVLIAHAPVWAQQPGPAPERSQNQPVPVQETLPADEMAPSESNPVQGRSAVPQVVPGPIPQTPQPGTPPLVSLRPTTQAATASRPTSMLDSLLGRSLARSQGSMNRFSRTPEFFGDNFTGGDMLVDTGSSLVRTDTPLAAASRRAKIADHNKAYPVDRAFVNYHHFGAAQNLEREGNAVDENAVDRFTVGFEQTFDRGLSSVEFRLPFAERYTVDDPDFQLVGGNVGNLAIIFKRLVHQTQTRAIAAGIGFDTPTGSDVRGSLPLQGVDFTFSNDSIHLLPYIGVVGAPGNRFYHMSFQLDVPINGNSIEVDNGSVLERAVLNETPYFYFDISGGYWFFRDCHSGCGLTGLAGVMEYHLTSTLGEGDFVSLAGGNTSFGVPQDLGISNMTVGLHAEFDYYTKLRIGGAFPLSEEPERFFNGEFMLSLIRHF